MDTILFAKLFTKIAVALIKRAIAKKIASTITSGICIQSNFSPSNQIECVDTNNACTDLSVDEVNVVSDVLSSYAVERLLNCRSDKFTVQKRKSGIYIASKLTSEFRTNEIVLPDSSKNDSICSPQIYHETFYANFKFDWGKVRYPPTCESIKKYDTFLRAGQDSSGRWYVLRLNSSNGRVAKICFKNP